MPLQALRNAARLRLSLRYVGSPVLRPPPSSTSSVASPPAAAGDRGSSSRRAISRSRTFCRIRIFSRMSDASLSRLFRSAPSISRTVGPFDLPSQLVDLRETDVHGVDGVVYSPGRGRSERRRAGEVLPPPDVVGVRRRPLVPGVCALASSGRISLDRAGGRRRTGRGGRLALLLREPSSLIVVVRRSIDGAVDGLRV